MVKIMENNELNLDTVMKLAEKENHVTKLKIGEIDGADVNIDVKKYIDKDTYYDVCASLSVPAFVNMEDGTATYVPSGET